MRARIERLRAWTHTHEGRKLIRFTCVSGVSTATSQLLLLLIFGVAHLWGVVASTFVANACATVPSYYLNRTWTWGKRGRSHLVKEIIPFWTMSALGIICAFFFSLWAHHLIHTHDWAHWIDTIVAMAVNFLAFAIFWVLKLLVFNRIFHVAAADKLEEVEERLEQDEAAEAGAARLHASEGFSPGS
jgi:putative flippase GtrA